MELFRFQEDASAQIAKRFGVYITDPLMVDRTRPVPFFQMLVSITGEWKDTHPGRHCGPNAVAPSAATGRAMALKGACGRLADLRQPRPWEVCGQHPRVHREAANYGLLALEPVESGCEGKNAHEA